MAGSSDSGKFPRPYVNSVKRDDSVMEYVKSFDTMGIGARSSGLPDSVSKGPKSLEHVGDNASKNMISIGSKK